MRIRATGAPLYRLKITLQNIKPPIWRRFLVPADITLLRLHDALQMVMGWPDSHLHQFEARGVVYGTGDPEFGYRCVSKRKTRLNEVLRAPKERMTYLYDFGDGWEHGIMLEAALPPEPCGMYPIIEAGKRACPPEDMGGPFGYPDFLEAITDPRHPEHHDLLGWAGGAFDPDAFSVREANLAIHGGRVRR